MIIEKFTECINNLGIPKNQWVYLDDINAIILSNGRGIYPNWRFERFKILDKSILIQHGQSIPYGARLGNNYNITYNYMGLQFPPGAVICPSDYYTEFRDPKINDIVRVSESSQKIICESLVSHVSYSMNMVSIDLAIPLKVTDRSHLSFYDPKDYDKEYSMHGNLVDGIYMNFSPNPARKKAKGIYHEEIKIDSIKEIHLKLSKKFKSYIIK